MIYRGVKMTGKAERKKEKRDCLRAVGYFVLGAALIAAVVIGTEQLGL